MSSFFAATCLASNSSIDCASNSSLKNDNNANIGSLQTLIIKRHPHMIPSFLNSIKGWDKEMAWAYSFGRGLGGAKSMLVKIEVEDGVGYMKVQPRDLFMFLSFQDFANGFLPQLLNMEQLSTVDLTSSISLTDLRSLFAKYALHSATMLIVDVAILIWLADEIHVKPVDQVVDVDQSVLEALCALSMYPEIEEHCIEDIERVLTEVRKLIVLDPNNEYFLSLVNIIKQLDPSAFKDQVEEIAVLTFSLLYSSQNKKIVLVCRILLGVNHDFVKAIEGSIPAVELGFINSWYKLIVNNNEMHSLSNVLNLGADPRELMFKIKDCFYVSANVVHDTLNWAHSIEHYQADYITFLNSRSLRTRMFIISQLQLPATLLSQIKLCTNWSQLRNLRRLGLTYGMTILKTNCLEVIWGSKLIQTPTLVDQLLWRA